MSMYNERREMIPLLLGLIVASFQFMRSSWMGVFSPSVVLAVWVCAERGSILIRSFGILIGLVFLALLMAGPFLNRKAHGVDVARDLPARHQGWVYFFVGIPASLILLILTSVVLVGIGILPHPSY